MKKLLSICLLTMMVLSLLFASTTSIANDNSPLSLPRGAYYSDKTIYVFVKYIEFGDFCDIFNRISIFRYERIVINLFSFGGSIFDALAMIGFLEEQQRQNKIVEIRAYGIIASAGLIIMMGGSPGYRFIDKNAFVMYHEMTTFKYLSVESVTDQEDQSKIARKIQDSINNYIASKTKLSVEEFSEKIKKREFWMDAQEAVQNGFADKIIGE